MKRRLSILMLASLFLITLKAQEGMWLLNQIGQLNLKQKGLQIAPEALYSPGKTGLYRAILQLGGGSASFVSPEGLIITNHHVAFTALQRASSTENDYLTNGFLARERSEEIQAPGYRARMLLEMKDVTEEVLAAAEGISDPKERDEAVNRKITTLAEAIEKDQEDVEAIVSEMYNGREYYLFVYKRFRDVRIVYAPPASIGKFGGEIDNWMWPRHTGDFSFLRVYVSPDGTGRAYSEENIPYKPEVWLKVADDDLDEGDPTFIMGFPGFTTRYRTSNSAEWNLRHNYPFSIRNFGEVIDLLDELTANDPEGHLKVASLRSGLANAMKNYQGKVDGMINTHFIQKKLDFEKEFMAWVNSNPVTKEKYGGILDGIKKTYGMIGRNKDRDNIAGLLQGLGGTPLSTAIRLYDLSREMAKPESEREQGYNDDLLKEIENNMQYLYANYYEPVDKAMMVRALSMVHELPEGQRIDGLEYIFKDKSKSIEQFVADAFAKSRLTDAEYARTLIRKSPEELESLNDPFITMAAKIWPMQEEINEVYEQFAAQVTDLRKQYITALYEWKGSAMYPDANGTMRFTSGPVMGYSPEDAVWYEPFTALNGVIAKDTGEEPFDVPDQLVKLQEKKDYGSWTDPDLNDVPVAFLHQCDITGGNSGSPVMNAKGEIIGVAFDGNYEAMISDWQYDFDLQRTISVDIRYVLFITEKFGKAGFILDEMGVEHLTGKAY
ncbi:MAG: S46 family peptidase [Bacteroidales bacterium]|nr:S46 family peptidase [Bacteroidales bacterium]